MRNKNSSPILLPLFVSLSCMVLPGCWKKAPSSAPVQSVESVESRSVNPVSIDLVRLKDRCLALLENGSEIDIEQKMLQEADAGFQKIARAFPKDPLGIQNRCITLLARLKKTDRIASAELYASLSKSLGTELPLLEQLVPDDPVAEILEARLDLYDSETELALEHLRKASRKRNATVDTHYQLYSQLAAEGTDATIKESIPVLEQAMKMSPGNLVIAIEWLKILAKKQSSEFSQHLATCRDLLRPVEARNNSKIPQIMANAASAAEKGNWQLAATQAQFLRNILLAEIVFLNDMHLLEPHDLEYVRIQFNAETQKQLIATSKVDSPLVRFVEKNQAWPIERCTAIATEDFDLDGNTDLWCASEKSLRVLGIDRDGKTTLLSDTTLSIPVVGLSIADLDHDFQQRKDTLPPSALPTTTPPGDPKTDSTEPMLTREQQLQRYLDTDLDVVVYGASGMRLYRNDLDESSGKRVLIEMPQSDGLSSLLDVQSVAIIDLDHDSDLDLAVASEGGVSLWSNRGDWTFANFTDYSTLPKQNVAVNHILALDADRNVLNDFLLASESTDDSLLLKSNLHGRYSLQSETWKDIGFGKQLCLNAIDANSDGCWDVMGCGSQGTRLTMMKSVGHHGWQPDSNLHLSKTPMQALIVEDFDNDGADECLAWGKNGYEYFRRDVSGKMAIESSMTSDLRNLQNVVTIDMDQDGDLDLVCLQASGKVTWLDNAGGEAHQHLELVIRADEDGKQRPRQRCNMHGVGSLVELKAGSIYQSRIVRGTKTRFGLGKKQEADVVRILWTNGIPNNVLGVNTRTTVFDQQNLGGSCPYLYTWNGDRFEFCTDCLWAAPIGLQVAQGQTVPTREWEYLKIDGKFLAPQDGEYILQLTEELWEAAYFDSVQLMAIDHPRDIEIYTNEKVGPPDISEFKIHFVQQRKLPQSIVDQNRRDLSEQTAVRDQRYTKTWDQGIHQGLTEEHFIEIDFGNIQDVSNFKLFLTGWLFPSCTSINVSMAENPLKPKSKAPSIWMPDEQGNWIEVIPFAGFPGGKTKTIAVDLSNRFLCDDRRIRLVSNMELCWDEIFYSDDSKTASSELLDGRPTDVACRVTVQPLKHADLHFRGFSRLVTQPYYAPKKYDYQQVTIESIWPPMTGRFTKLGEVTDLLVDADDLQAVMGAGDEMTLRFQSTDPALPEGWVRDFVLFNVGWDKDADLNTVHGQSVEPLPFRSMKQYPYQPHQFFPDSPRHREFVETRQTRIQSSIHFWNQIRDFESTRTTTD